MSQQAYLKVPFAWEEPKPLIEVPSRLKFKAVKTLNYEVLLSVVAQVMESSIGTTDRKRIMERGSRQVAEQLLAKSKDGFSYQDEWRQVGVSSNDRVIGFVFPVIYQGGAKEGLEEATIYYIGVLPEHRGQGFATDLLLKGTRVLQDVGVWRVSYDTDVNNIPMISTFAQAEYWQHSDPWQRPL